MKYDMNKLAQLLIVATVGILTAVGCQQDPFTRDYRVDEIEIVSEGVFEEGIRLTYRVPGETLYHSPGASLVRRGKKAYLTFPRVHIDADDSSVDLKSAFNEDGSFTITVPNENTDSHPIEIILNGEKSLGAWSFEPAE